MMTDEQFNILAQYEHNYETALKANYSRYPGREGVDQMFNTYRDITGSRNNINRSCSVCILNLVKKVGKLYFEEKTRREEEARMKAEELKKQEEVKTEPETKPDKAKKAPKKTTKKKEAK